MKTGTIEIKKKLEITDAYSVLEKSVHAALENYSNVHRGSGHFSMVTTHLFEQAREIVLEYLALSKRKFTVIFCTPLSASKLIAQLDTENYRILSSHDYGLPFGVKALTIRKKALPKEVPYQTGGGTARLMALDWIVWEKAPDRFEAGTPAIINIIAFARALRLIKQSGGDIFLNPAPENKTAAEILHSDELEKYSGKELLDELRKTLIGRGVQVPTTSGEKAFINFDYAASSPTFKPVWNAVRQTWRQPKNVLQEIVQEVRSVCAEMLGAPQSDYDIIFTSNTTEAINLAAESLSRESEEGIEPVVLSSLLEHSSNDLPWRMVPNHSVIRLSIDKEGFFDLNELEKLLREYNQERRFGNKRIKLVAVSGASNVLGTYNNLAEISRIVHQFDVRLLVDAAQLVAHRKVDIGEFGIDYLAFSAHKVYAPFGSGALVVKKGLLRFTPAEMEYIQSSGEENTGGIAALGKAHVVLKRIGMDVIQQEEQVLTKKVVKGLAQIEGIQTFGVTDTNSPNFAQRGSVIAFFLKGKVSSSVGKELAIKGGIGVRYGCHCAHVLVKHILGVGPKLEKFQRIIVTLFPKLQLPGVIRVSLGIENSEEDVDTFLKVLTKIVAKSEKSEGKQTIPTQKSSLVLPKSEVQKQMKEFVKAASERVYFQQ
ncbi:MAG TPA: aminotransferase class V-fold PLP-dependent enzyme [Draconibacterium sp.]|nr:aminotransferase class V-fold PLP-dependent enzyme [Draconibacterium sp.]